mgnify:CR=1 FL=1
MPKTVNINGTDVPIVNENTKRSDETVLIVTQLVRLMSRVEILEGRLSKIGKTISVTMQNGRTKRLKAAKIFGGDGVFRDGRSFHLYSFSELESSERSNYVGSAPVAGHSKKTERKDMRTPTHVHEDDPILDEITESDADEPDAGDTEETNTEETDTTDALMTREKPEPDAEEWATIEVAQAWTADEQHAHVDETERFAHDHGRMYWDRENGEYVDRSVVEQAEADAKRLRELAREQAKQDEQERSIELKREAMRLFVTDNPKAAYKVFQSDPLANDVSYIDFCEGMGKMIRSKIDRIVHDAKMYR